MNKDKLAAIVLATAVALGTLTSPSGARTWNIQSDGLGDAPTIQAGIDSATAGDIVLLASGTFAGAGNKNIDFQGKAITVTSMFGASATIINCGGDARAFLFDSGEGPSSVVSGITIDGGFANFFGGAISCRASSPSIRDNVFKNNTSGFQGGAVYCDISSALIMNNEFLGNQAPSGGGLWCSGGSSITVSGNLFRGCVAANVGGAMACNASNPLITGNVFSQNGTSGQGGALDLVAGSAPIIRKNTFELNQASSGGAIRCAQSSPMITQNTFTNSAAGTGGAIFCDNVARPSIRNNTFIVTSPLAVGDAIYCNNFSDAQIHGNIIVGSVGRAVESANFSQPEIGCSNFFDNAGGDGLPAGSVDAGGNISADPLFCKGGGGHYLQQGSPSAGSNGCGVMGAFPVGCGISEQKRRFESPDTAGKTEHQTWGSIKSLFHQDDGR